MLVGRSDVKEEGDSMAISLTVYNETLFGAKDPALTLDFLNVLERLLPRTILLQIEL